MTYLPQSDTEFVTLACWAFNAVGQQKSPCLIHIIPASELMHIYNYREKDRQH